MLDVRRMKVLREVAARGSFSAAAEALSFTQSAVSQQVAALEKEAGAKLVERGARGIRLTEAGEALVGHADAILSRIDDAEQELAAIAGLKGGRLRLACFQSAGATLVPRAVAEFSKRHPKVELGLRQAEPEEAHEAMCAGDIDLALIYDFQDNPMPFADLEVVPLLDDAYDMVMREDHPHAKRRRVSLADFKDDTWINSTSGCGCHHLMMGACRREGFEPHVSIETDDNEAVQAFVAAGAGIGLLPKLALTTVREGLVARDLGPNAPARRILAATLADGYRSPATEAMIEIFCTVASEFEARRPLAAAS
jgi:DNA-binding transcriptional LysR family regulator